MFDELLTREMEIKNDLEQLKISEAEKVQILAELTKAKTAYNIYHLLLNSQGKLQLKIRDESVELQTLSESWRDRLLTSILSVDPSNKFLLEHKARAKVLQDSIEVFREMERMIERELEKCKTDAFKINKVAAEIRSRLDFQEKHRKAGYEFSDDGILLR